ncbi:flavonol reductase [Periconia macrospinosa]|uniref:Flavonol reductase n=1 Tax=Periconia macrospinosa TaxID=97972 RepID=A0A2V1D2X1_9PLEO|nr:flavonol reductase [Periconia macrospinosa]
MSKISLVTGGGGYIASHLVQQLLEDGNTVHATVRNVKDEKKIGHLLSMQTKWPGKLTLFEADLLTARSFDAAMQQCSTVYHVASPFFLEEQIKNPQKDVIEPALRGTQNVLGAVEENSNVELVVMTSTVGAIFGDYADVRSMENNTLSEMYFNTSSTATHNAYHFSKVLAEKEAWRLWEAQNKKRWKLVTINPGLVLGPPLSPSSDSGSLFLIEELLRGDLWFGVPDLWFTTVDVREVARAHINAAQNPDSNGRYILTEKEMTSFRSLSLIFRPLYNHPWRLPRHAIPNIVTRIVGPLFGLTQKWMSLNLGVKFSVDNHRSIEELNIVYRPLEETLEDYYKSITEKEN